MEQARLFIAIALSILVFVVWEAFFVPKTPMPKSPGLEKTEIAENQPGGLSAPSDLKSIENSSIKPNETFSKIETVVEKPSRPPRTILISSNLYHLKILEQGGKIISFTLNDYKEEFQSPNFKEMVSKQLKTGTLQLSLLNKSIPGLKNAFFETSHIGDTITVDSKKELELFWISPNGFKIIKSFIFYPDNYLFDYNVTIENNSQLSLDDSLKISLVNTLPKKRGYGFEGPCALIDKKLQEVKIKKIKEKNIYSGNLDWVAIQDRYFLTGIIPVANANSSMHLKHSEQLSNVIQEEGAIDIVETNLVKMMEPILPGYAKKYDFKVYIGPKSVSILKKVGYKFDKAVDFGWFDFIAKPCLWLMNKFYEFVPNYGIAIIVLTILIKLLFWPLGTKSYRSMNEMKKLQPLMAEIREKHKKDSQRMNQEIMALYKTYKVNPLGGCLPMLAQMPIFFALYRMLYSAIELRHAHFFGWITDLSAPDRLFNFGVTIPFFEPPTGIPVLTLIMGATMFLQQKMAPPAGDPQQAKMMMMMPLFMTIIFINFSSGLVLYWLINNILSIAQQYFITKQSE